MNLLKWLPLQLLHGQNKTMTIKALYPTTRPTLDLNFAAAKRLDPRITYTRASTGTFVGSNGLIQSAAVNQARFEHNPLTGESLGLLVEDARTNLVRYSQDMTDVTWSKTNLTVTKETIAGPAGTIGYDKVTLGTFTATAAQLRMSITLTPGTLCSNSIYVKQGTCRYVYLVQQFTNSGGTGAYFDLQTGTFLTGGGLTASSTTIQALANGWYRIQLTVTDVGPGGSAGFILIPMTIPNPAINNSGGRQYNGNGEFIYAYGAQIEAGSFPTSYIPTVASAVTRATDVASITGANFSSWFNYSQSTMYTEGVFIGDPYDGNYGYLSTFDVGTNDGSFYSRIRLLDSNDTAVFQSTLPSINSTTGNITLAIGANAKNTVIKQIHSITNAASASAAVNGTLGTAVISSSIQVPDRVQLGKHGTAYRTTCYLRRFAYYPVRLPDAQLQALTAT
jgi:hypothetical protein